MSLPKKHKKLLANVFSITTGKLIEITIGVIIAGIGVSYLWLIDHLEQYMNMWVAHTVVITLIIILIGNLLAHLLLKKKRYRFIALFTGMLVSIMLIMIVTIESMERNKPKNTFVVLVSQFDTSSNDDFKMQEFIIDGLQKYKTEIRTIPNYTKIIRDSAEAKKEGKKHQADIVLWGSYSVPGNIKEVANINFEILTNVNASKILSDDAKGGFVWHTVKEDHQLTIQTNVTKNAAYVSLFVIGLAKHQKEDWNGAEKEFLKALTELPEHSPFIDQSILYRYLGHTSYKKQNYTQAIAYLTKAITIKGNLTPALIWYNRGVAYYAVNNLEAAKKDYTEAIAKDKNYADAYLNRGVILANQKHYTEAIKDYEKAIAINDKDDLAYFNRGGSYAKLEKLDQALADYSKAIELNPSRANNYTARAALYSRKGELENAIKDYTQALKKHPTKKIAADTYFLRGYVYFEQNNVDLGFADLEKIFTLTPHDTERLRIVAGSYFFYSGQEKDTKKAAQYLKKAHLYNEKAIQFNPKDAEAYAQRGSLFLADNTEKACKDFDTAIQMSNQLPNAYTGRAFCYYYIDKNKQAALADYKSAIDLYNTQIEEADNQEVKNALQVLKHAAENFYSAISTASAVPTN